MIKRKRGEPPELGRFGLSLVMGIVALIVLTLIGAVVLLTNKIPEATPVARIVTATPPPPPTRIRTNTPLPSPTWVPMPTGVPRLPAGGSLVYSTIMQEIVRFDGDGMRTLRLRGEDVVVSPNGQKLAYVRNGQLFIYQDGKETLVETPGTAGLPAWDADSTALVFAIIQDHSDTVFRLPPDQSTPRLVLTVPSLVAPPLPLPREHRLLIAGMLQSGQTELYTIDELCASAEACKKSREDIATVPYTISSMAYHPNGLYIFFTEYETGNLYALATGSKAITQIASDGIFKRRVAVGQDPAKLVYIDLNSNLFLFDLESGASVQLMPTAVANVSWSGGG